MIFRPYYFDSHISSNPNVNVLVLQYDKRITICTIEDVPAGEFCELSTFSREFLGTELCFNYQMTQYNIGCPLPDCKCGAPNCTGTLGSVGQPFTYLCILCSLRAFSSS
ncbi:hypothetical protein ANCDUO_06811 [Ancylostoma duodenale]|uniref:Post-SET domain-containing protein n=1 Tax=Ancylostoma duodenale TaxID=51022 RepID=A0A0C2GV71_9BILA|nr:hypothetical protein ANCDUO_06811 [Ancylostoma duodenale]